MNEQVKKIYTKLFDLHEGLIDNLENEELSEIEMREIKVQEMLLLNLMGYVTDIVKEGERVC